jgi:tetratricopeptide (TPR) repeat protein
MPDESIAPPPNDPAELERQAAECRRQGQLLPALHLYDRVIELEAATHDTWFATGDTLTEVGEYAQAIGAYEHALELRANEPKTHHDLARAVYRLGEVDRAVAHLELSAAHTEPPRACRNWTTSSATAWSPARVRTGSTPNSSCACP